MNLNFTEGVAGEFTQDLIQHATRTSTNTTATESAEVLIPTVDSSKCVPALDKLITLTFTEEIAGGFTQDFIQHALKQTAVCEAYTKRTEEGALARQSWTDTYELTRLFKFRHTSCDDEAIGTFVWKRNHKNLLKSLMWKKHEINDHNQKAF